MKQLMYTGILTAALLVLLANPVLATDAFNRPGPYLGLGMAGGLSEFSGAARGAEDSLGFNFHGGYRFNDYFAVEGLYEYMDEFSKTLEDCGRASQGAHRHEQFQPHDEGNSPHLRLEPTSTVRCGRDRLHGSERGRGSTEW